MNITNFKHCKTVNPPPGLLNLMWWGGLHSLITWVPEPAGMQAPCRVSKAMPVEGMRQMKNSQWSSRLGGLDVRLKTLPLKAIYIMKPNDGYFMEMTKERLYGHRNI
jgi:hypothetical protein